MSTIRLRRYSPSPLACGSGRVDEATPSPSRPTTTKLRARRLGNAWRWTASPAASGSSWPEALEGQLGVRATPTPRRTGPTARRWRCLPCRPTGPRSGSRGDGAPSDPTGGAAARLGPRAPRPVPRARPGRRMRPLPSRRRIGSRERPVSVVGHVDPGAVGQDDGGDHQLGRHQRRPVDAVGGAPAGRRGDVQAGVAGQRQFGGRPREPASHPFGVAVLDRDTELGRGLGVGRRVGACPSGSAGRRTRRTGRSRPAASRQRPRRVRSALASMSRPVSTKVMVLRQPAEQVERRP